MKFTERYPNYVDVVKRLSYEVNSIDDFKKLDRVKNAINWPDFYRLSIDDRNQTYGRMLLMAETKNGYEWWAIGWLDGPYEDWLDNIPDWEPKY